MKTRWICLLLTLAMLPVFLAGCNTPEKEPATTQKNSDWGAPLPAGALALVHKGKANFTVVYSCMSAQRQVFANEIADRIEEVTGVQFPVEIDLKSQNGHEHEIRVGKISRMGALELYDSWSSLGKTDYAVAVKGGHIYLYGTTEAALENAVAYFLDRMPMLDKAWAAVDGTEFERAVLEGDRPTVAFDSFDGTYATFALNADEVNESEMRISLTPNTGWRIRTGTAQDADYRDMGAAQGFCSTITRK